MRVKGQVYVQEEIYIDTMTDLWINKGVTPTEVGMLSAITENIREVVPLVVTLEEMVGMPDDVLRRKGVTKAEIAIFDSQVNDAFVFVGSGWVRSLIGS